MDEHISELIKLRNRTLVKERATITIDSSLNKNGELIHSFDSELKFSDDATHTISLTMLVMPALFPNLDNENNKFFYYNGTTEKTLTIDTGSYDIDEYGDIVKELLKVNNDDPDCITIRLNKGSGKCIVKIKDNYRVYFRNGSWYKSLGFDLNTPLQAGTHFSHRIVNVTSTQVIHVECDLVDSRHNKYDGKPSQIIYSFPADLPYGQLYEFRKDYNLTAKTLGRKIFNSLKLKFYDSKMKPITVLGEEVNCELQIIQV